MMRVKIIVLFLLTHSLSAQPVSSSGKQQQELDVADFEEAKSLFEKKMNSPNWQKADSIRQSIIFRQVGTDAPELHNDTLYIPWIKKNLHLTKFRSVDEVLSLRQQLKNLNVLVLNENVRLHQLMGKASLEQMKEIVQPFLNRARGIQTKD